VPSGTVELQDVESACTGQQVSREFQGMSSRTQSRGERGTAEPLCVQGKWDLPTESGGV
jgi:hypothetical protein